MVYIIKPHSVPISCYSFQAQLQRDARVPRQKAQSPLPYRRFTTALTILLLFIALGSRKILAAEDEIILGMSTALTGNAANLGKDMQQGILAGLERANRSGGVNGRKLRLITLDDGTNQHAQLPICCS